MASPSPMGPCAKQGNCYMAFQLFVPGQRNWRAAEFNLRKHMNDAESDFWLTFLSKLHVFWASCHSIFLFRTIHIREDIDPYMQKTAKMTLCQLGMNEFHCNCIKFIWNLPSLVLFTMYS